MKKKKKKLTPKQFLDKAIKQWAKEYEPLYYPYNVK
jgi:hypothetical protein